MVLSFWLLLVLEWGWPNGYAIDAYTEKLLSCCPENTLSETKRALCSYGSNRLNIFNVDVRWSFQVTLAIGMPYSQLASSSSGNRCGRQHGQTASDSIDFVQLSVGIAEGRFVFDFFHDLCLFLCYLVVMLKVDHAQKETWTLFQLRALYKGTGHASRLERTPP